MYVRMQFFLCSIFLCFVYSILEKQLIFTGNFYKYTSVSEKLHDFFLPILKDIL